MMRCSVIMHSFGGGAEAVALTLARHLDRAQFGVEVLCTRHIPELAASMPEDVPCSMPARSGWRAALTHVAHMWRAARDSAVVLGSLELQSIFWAALLAPGRAVAWLHKDVEGYLRVKGRAYGFIYRHLLGRALRRCVRVVCVSQGVREATARLWPDVAPRLTVLWNPVDVQALRQRALAPLPPALEPLFAQPVILGVGRLEAQKAFEDLLLAHEELLRRGCTHHLCILGEGTERSRLEALVRQRGLQGTAYLPGFYDPCPCMARSRALAVSSVFEGLSLVLIEALALGLPVVSTDCPSGPREVLCGGQYGALVPMGDTGAMADALQGILEHGVAPERQAAGQRRAEDFSLPVTVGAWEEVLRAAAGRSAARHA